jgi:histidinol-phosphate aminotransferase
MKTVEDYIVPWVRAAESYNDRHMDFAWGHPEVVRMMSNENPLPPAEGVIRAVLEAAYQGNLYPGSGQELRKRLSEPLGLGPDNVILGNGSTDIINFVIETFVAPGEEVLIPVPTFSMYETRTLVNGGVPVLVPMRADYYWDMEAILAAATEKTKLIFISTPNNPTGNQILESDLDRILALGIPTFIDEAYYELAEHPCTYAPLVNDNPHVLVNRTFSKAYGLAGLRLGYLFAHERVISYLNRKRIPWNVSLLAMAAALAALEDGTDQLRKRELILAGRNYLCEAIGKLPGLRAYPSDGNFVLIDASVLGKPSREIVDELIARGVFVRPMSSHHMQGFLRVTVWDAEQNRAFVEKLRTYIEEITSTGLP